MGRASTATLVAEGVLCQGCGCALSDATGFPTWCGECEPAEPSLEILALDVASATGWARYVGGEISSGVVKLRQRTVRGVKEPRGAKFSGFRRWLEGQSRPDVLVLERVGHFKSAAAAETVHGLLAIAEGWAYEVGVPVEYLSPMTVKKHATGRGNASKNDMLAAAAQRWPGVRFADDNEADARHLGDCYLARLGDRCRED